MARRFCALLLVLGLAAAAAAQAYSDARTPQRPCGSIVATLNDRTDAVVRLTRATLHVLALVSDLPAWLSERRGDGRSWGDEMKAAIAELKLSFAEASGRARGAV